MLLLVTSKGPGARPLWPQQTLVKSGRFRGTLWGVVVASRKRHAFLVGRTDAVVAMAWALSAPIVGRGREIIVALHYSKAMLMVRILTVGRYVTHNMKSYQYCTCVHVCFKTWITAVFLLMTTNILRSTGIYPCKQTAPTLTSAKNIWHSMRETLSNWSRSPKTRQFTW